MINQCVYKVEPFELFCLAKLFTHWGHTLGWSELILAFNLQLYTFCCQCEFLASKSCLGYELSVSLGTCCCQLRAGGGFL